MPCSRALAQFVAVAVVAVGGAGCTAAELIEATPAPTDVVSFDDSRMGPLPGMPSCPAQLPAATSEDVPTIPLPSGTIVTSVTAQAGLTNLEGYLPYTPVQTRAFYAGVQEATVLQSEDEGRETEILITTGPERIFIKAGAVCDVGSSFVAVIAPDDSGATVPTPAGTMTPATSG